jgi:hypothetical protein
MIKEDKIISAIRWIKRGYLILIFIGLWGLFGKIILDHTIYENLRVIIILLIDITIYYGLRYRKEWVIALILFVSTFSLIFLFLRIVLGQVATEYTTVFSLTIAYIIIIALSLFYFFQIYFFSKKDVRIFWRTKGHILF